MQAKLGDELLAAYLTDRLVCVKLCYMNETATQRFVHDTGGSTSVAKSPRDCVARAIAIATETPYDEVCALITTHAKKERIGKRKRGKSTPKSGVYKATIHKVMKDLGWVWTPTMRIGSGCTTHLRADELPAGRLVVSLSKHLTAMIDGVIHDTHDPSRSGTRCVYGFWSAP